MSFVRAAISAYFNSYNIQSNSYYVRHITLTQCVTRTCVVSFLRFSICSELCCRPVDTTDMALSITLTAIVSLVTPLTIPIFGGLVLEWQLGDQSEIVLPFLSTFAKLVVITLIPVLLGMLLRHYRAAFCLRYERAITRIPLIMLLLVIGGIIWQNRSSMALFLDQTGVPALMLSSIALGLGYAVAKLARLQVRTARTIAIETGIQNGGTAILVTGTILNNPNMTIAPVMYGILMLIPTFAYILWLSRRREAIA